MTCFRWHHYCLNLSPPNCVEHFYHHQKLIKELQQEEGDIQGLKRVWESKHYRDENIKSFSILLVGWMICLQFFQVLFVLIWQVKCSIIPTLYCIWETFNNQSFRIFVRLKNISIYIYVIGSYQSSVLVYRTQLCLHHNAVQLSVLTLSGFQADLGFRIQLISIDFARSPPLASII